MECENYILGQSLEKYWNCWILWTCLPWPETWIDTLIKNNMTYFRVSLDTTSLISTRQSTQSLRLSALDSGFLKKTSTDKQVSIKTLLLSLNYIRGF